MTIAVHLKDIYLQKGHFTDSSVLLVQWYVKIMEAEGTGNKYLENDAGDKNVRPTFK